MNNILKRFIREPEREFHIRELAKYTQKSPATIAKYLADYEKKEYLTHERRLNHLLYKADTANSAFKELKMGHNQRLLRTTGLIQHLVDTFNHPEAIILFGSFAKGEDGPKSDVDILIVTPAKKKVNLALFEKKISRPIQLFVHSRDEIERMKIKNKELLNNWINGRVIGGFWELFR